MWDLVENPDCWFSHAKAQLLCSNSFLLFPPQPKNKDKEKDKEKDKGGGPSEEDKKTEGEKLGSGRLIPIKQGYLYKKSHGLNKEWKKKYVTLLDDGRLTYHPSLHVSSV